MEEELTRFSGDMKKELKESLDLEFVLQVINVIRNTSMQMERQTDEIKERARTLTISRH
jgi:hypothetical protein